MICAKLLAAAAALAGLLAAGCGSKPTPKPTAPPEAAAPTKADKAPRVTRVGFSVHYPNGWMAHTTFGEDLSVSGRHRSGGEAPRLHLANDKASPEFWAKLSELALKASALPMRELQPRPEKVCIIVIDLSDGRNLRFETALDAGYQDAALQALADLLHANERIYSHQQGQGWTLAVSKDPAARPTEIAWGRAVDVLQVGLKAARPAFAEGEPLAFTVHLRNFGDAAKDVGGIFFDDFVFQPQGGGTALRARWTGPTAARPVNYHPMIEAGRGLEYPQTIGGEDWHFEDASQPRQEKVAAPVRFPAPGKYSVTVGSTPGRIPSGPVEIEIKAKAAAVALNEAQIIAKARAIGRQRWPEQVSDWPRDRRAEVLDQKPVVTRNGDNWTVVFETTPPEIAGSRATVSLDSSGRELSTKCEFSPR